MTLVEKKRINLDRPMNQYLGNAKLRALWQRRRRYSSPRCQPLVWVALP